ncbi:hypothetical protein E2C01_069804 [Portunus trituberculatus]|uniref:Uncharacterized protein n=1 Tax=Portunus trituberculatus TaxID=210409 RepID=A0A5B7I1U1_PORTR|nr:hypothetical protein [Portunus trituberculatus]
MLEPYQPEYKALNHSPACPLAPTTPTQTQPRPQNAKPLLPRKSSSLCFTPSMLRTVSSLGLDLDAIGDSEMFLLNRNLDALFYETEDVNVLCRNVYEVLNVHRS